MVKLSRYKYELLLVLVFLFSLAFHLYFSFQTPYFSDDSAYLNLRQVDYVVEHGRPMFYDDLSYGSRPVLSLPLFPYVMALFSLVPLGLKIFPSVLLASIVFFVYLIALKLSDDKFSSLVAALMAAFIPVLISSTLNKLSVFSLVLPLLLLMFYSLVSIRKKIFLYIFVVLSFALPLLHPIALFFVLSMLIFYVLALAEDIEVSHIGREAMVFSAFLIVFIEFLFFRSAFLSLGFRFVWHNIPSELLASYFRDLNLIDVMLKLGVLPFVFGIVGYAFGFFKDKSVGVFSLMSAAFAALLLLVFKLVDFSVGLMLLGIVLALASSLSIQKFFKYLKLTKFSRFHYVFKFLLVLLVFLTLVVPSFFSAHDVLAGTLTDNDYLVLLAVRDETERDATVLSLYSEGNYITAVGERKSVMDSDFLGAPSVNTRFEDVRDVYTSVSEVKVLQILEKYHVGYVYFTPRVKKFYNVQNLSFVEDEKCFVEYRKSGEVYLYKVRC